MHDRLYDKLCRILDDMDAKDKLSASDVQIIDWVTHAKKSMLATDEMEGGYSENSYGGRSYGERSNGGSYRGNSYDDGMSSYGRGRNAKRDSMGRYASDGYSRNYPRAEGKEDFKEHLYEMMENAPDEKTRQNIQRMIRDMEQA